VDLSAGNCHERNPDLRSKYNDCKNTFVGEKIVKSITKQPTNKSLLQVTAYFVGVLLISLCGLAIPAQMATQQENSAPGTRPKKISPGSPGFEIPLVGIAPLITQTGNITLSMDGLGTLNSTGSIEVEKPAGATVRAAYLAAASTGFSGRTLVNGDVKINGSNVIFTMTVPSTIGSSNSFGEVTTIVKPIVDAAPAGIVSLTITEVSTAGIDGEILAVVFDDPAQTTTNTIFILFGAQNIAGDTFNITTADPINPLKPIDMSLGISYSFQHPSLAISQDSIINVNGTRVSSSAGGQDDSDALILDNGALLTVGGIGDSNANPPPFVTNGGNHRTDDELYDLRPFVTAGSTNITVFTQNPSNDDNIFFAGFFFKDQTATIGGDCTLTCPASISISNTPNQCSAVVNYAAPTTTGACGTVSCSPASGSTFPQGTTTVTCTAPGPPPQTCLFTVTVNDTQAATITCPASITTSNTPGQCSAVVTYPPPTVSDNCSNVGTPVCNPASGSSFSKGITTVTCNVADASGNNASCSFTITVNDTQNPTITCPANVTRGTDPNVCNALVTYPNATATDNCSGAGAASCSPSSGSTFPKGVTTVTCTVMDAANNSASCTFTVTVNDTQNPTITCPPNQSATSSGGNVNVTYPPPTVSDNCPGVGTPTCIPASGSSFPPGSTTVNCTVTDASGNSNTCSFTVSVLDCTITCPANITRSNDPNQCGAVATYSAPPASKNCGSITCSPASGSFFPVGTTTVTCSAGIGTTCTFTIRVNETQAPTITCPGNVVSIGAPACAGVAGTVTYPPPTVSDNCSGVTTVCSPASGSIFPLGTTTVTCTATDASGNTASCSFVVKVFNACVQDRSNPAAVLAWNFTTGEYIFCCNGSTFTGVGKVAVAGCTYTLDHTPVDRRVHGQVDFTTFRGEGFLQVPSGTARCSISDDDVRDNDCSCTGALPPGRPGSK
jgi:hypothetical protein